MTTYTSRETYEFISKETNDPIVEWKTCKVSGQPFPIYQSDLEFYDKISPTFNGKKYQIPLPTLCPEERQRRKLVRRNEGKLYRRKCDMTGEGIISIYSPDKPYKVYKQDIWWSDKRDSLEYGQVFDEAKSFTEQFDTLLKAVPHNTLYSTNPENAEYTNFALNDKNCYLVFGGGNNENCCYCDVMSDSSHIVDGYSVFSSSYCYQVVYVEKCYNCQYLLNCNNCSHSMFLEECEGCDNCVMCFGLVNKKNHFLNQPVSEEMIKEVKKMLIDQPFENTTFYQQFEALKKQSTYRTHHNFGNEQVGGEMIVHSKNCYNSYAIHNCVDCRNISFMHNAEGSRDCDYASPLAANFSYNLCSATGTCNSMTVFLCFRNQSLYYSSLCFDCSDCFGCVGLRNKQYCIFNKQYPNSIEYEKEVARIIETMISNGERGEFFHPSLTPFGYNETVANEYLPLEKTDIISGENSLSQYGYKWSDYSSDPKIPENASLLSPAEMSHDDWKVLVDDDRVVNKVIICKESGRPFAIQKMELAFYRKLGLQLPKQHPDVRHEARMKQRSGRVLHLRTCDKCGKEMVSIYPAEEVKTVYCEECYRQEVYG